MKHMRVRLLSLVLVVAMIVALLPGNRVVTSAAQGVSGTENQSGVKYVYIPTPDLTTASRYGGSGLHGNFIDSYSGGTNECGNKTLLLQADGDYVEYDIDLADDAASAVLKVYATSAVVSVKPEGGEFQTMTARNGAAANRGVNLFDLTTANALSAVDKKFTVRISFGGSTVVLNSLAVVAEQPELSEAYELELLGENYMAQLEDVSANATRYFDQGVNPTVWLHNGEAVAFRFDYEDSILDVEYLYGALGAALIGEVSVDGTSWTTLSASGGKLAEQVTLPENKVFYLRFTAQGGDAFLKNLSLKPVYKSIAVEDTWYQRVTDLTNTFAYGGNIVPGFNDTYNGGSSAENPTLLLNDAGDFVEYYFDLPDDAASTVLKLYMTGAKVLVKPEGGEYTVLTARNEEGGSFNRNVAVYDLNDSNALSRADRRFMLRIESAAGGTVLQGIYITVKEHELAQAYELDPLGESYLANFYTASQGVNRFFDNGNQPAIHVVNGQSLTFRFDFIDSIESFSYAYGQVGSPLTAEVSGDGNTWHAMEQSGHLEDAMELPAGNVFYIRFTAAAGDGFLKTLTVTPENKNVPEKPVEEADDIYLPIKDLSNAARYGGDSIAEGFNDQHIDGGKAVNPSLLLQSAGDYVEYDFNLPDDVNRATLKLYLKDGVVSVKPAGGAYKNLTARNDQGGHFDRNVAIYDLTTDNALAAENRQFTVRISCDGTAAVLLNALLIETKKYEESGTYEFQALGESFIRNVKDVSQGATRYFADMQDATLFLHRGESVVLDFDFPDKVESLAYSMTVLGEPLTAEVSADGATWAKLPAGGRIEDALSFNEKRTFSIRFTAEKGESFLRKLTITPVEKLVETEQNYVYLPIHDLSNASGFGGNTIAQDFIDTFTGGNDTVVNKTLLLQHDGDYVEYDFNLTDEVKNATLKIYMKDAVVSVKPEGGSYKTLTASNEEGGNFDRGVAIYKLTSENALAAASRKFTVRIAAGAMEAAVLNGLVLDAEDPVIASGRYELEPLGESFLAGVYDLAQSTTRYFYQGNIPTVFIKKGGQVTFRLKFADGGKAYLVNYEVLGAESTVQVSLDGKKWEKLKGQRVDKLFGMNGAGTFYVRFAAENGDSFLRSLVATREETEPLDYNTNPNVPVDSTYVYFKPGTAEEEKYMFGMGTDYKAYFAQTHSGMGIDGYEGGYSTKLPNNVRIFDENKHVTYEFDLADSLTEARLKVYGLAGMKFLVSVDRDDGWEELTTEEQPTGSSRGYYIFTLNKKNALKNADNKFRLKIQGTPYGRLFELMVEAGVPALTHGVQFEAQTEDAMRYLESTAGLRTYYAYEAWANYYLDENGRLLFKVPFANDVDTASLYVTYSGGTKVEVSTGEKSGYVTLLDSKLGPSGTPWTNTYDLSKYLKKSRTLYIRVTGTVAGAFVDSMGIAITPKNTASGGFTAFQKSEADYLYQVQDNGQGVGTSMRQAKGFVKVRGVDVGGSVTYKFDLPAGASGVDVKLDAVGNYQLEASLDGKEFSSVVSIGKKTDGIRILDPLTDSRDKVLYLRISNLSTSDILMIRGLAFSTKGIPSYERPKTSDFDYDKELPGSFATVERLNRPNDPDAIYGTKESKDVGFPWMWASIGGAAVVVLIAGGIVWVLLAKKKKKAADNNQA